MNSNRQKKVYGQTEGFDINTAYQHLKNISRLSLSKSLRAYVETYNNMSSKLNSPNDGTKVDAHTPSYIINSYTAITFFHHFAEIALKEILENAGVNLNKISGFQAALKIIIEKLNESSLDTKYSYIKRYENKLFDVNDLRNQLYHSGSYALNYANLDVIFGKTIFPFINDYYEGNSPFFGKTEDGFNPYLEIINHFETESYDYKKVGVLKEIARSIDNVKIRRCLVPSTIINSSGELEEIVIDYFKSETDRKIKEIEELADKKVENAGGEIYVEECPICKTKTLLAHWDWFDNGVDNYGNPIPPCGNYVCIIRCENCTFELSNTMSDVKIGNLDLSKYFKVI